jgi:predicted DNA binding protein
MYEAQIHLQQNKSCVLTRLAQDFESPLDVQIEELHDENVTFVINAGDNVHEFYERLVESDHVHRVERLDSENLGVTKASCGAYSAIYGNHGILRRRNHFSDTERVYNILFFDRDDLKAIIDDFRDIGEVTLSSLTQVGSESARLTARQREVIQTAFDLGYYEVPRAASTETVADELGLDSSTVAEHLQRAERNLLSEQLSSGS